MKKNIAPGALVAVVFVALLAVFPLLCSENYILHVGILCMMYACYTSSWNMISGFAGIFGLGFQALAGLGGYTSSLIAMHLGISPWISIFIGGFGAMIIGALFSVPCLKLKEMPYIAISSQCLGEVARLVVANNVDLTRGEMGLWGMPFFSNIGPIVFDGGNRISHWYLVLVFLIVYMLVVNHISKSPLGRALNTIRDSQPAASSLGVDVTKTKVTIYMIASFMVGLIGGFYAHYMQILTPTAVLGPTMMTMIVAMTLIGGMGTIAGPIIGAFFITILTESLRVLGDYRLIAYGLLIVLCIIFLPNGIWGTAKPKVLAYIDYKSKKVNA